MTSPWENPKTEVGKWWKAYATGTIDESLESTCRETKLLHKILDPSYELDFTVDEKSSRIEKYLYDILNGTQNMAANTPKSDSEILLRGMIGFDIPESDMPIIDCERLYWMSMVASELPPYDEWALMLDPESGSLYQKQGQGVKFLLDQDTGVLYYNNSKTELLYDEETGSLYGPSELLKEE